MWRGDPAEFRITFPKVRGWTFDAGSVTIMGVSRFRRALQRSVLSPMGGNPASDDGYAPTAPPRQPFALPQYEVLGYLGGGGMGDIYRARHIHLDRQVVIKLLRTEMGGNDQLDARFAREMLAVGQLQHPNIVSATDAGIIDGRRYLVMEYIDGIDLAELSRRVGRLSIADACEIIRQSAGGLAHAHQRGIVHRDIKPTNLMLASDGAVKLLDLGLALLQDGETEGEDEPLTRADSGPFGTYDYMSPEQWDNSHSVGPRGDIYSLGCTLYFLLTGHAPFDRPGYKSPTAKMRGHVLEAVPSIRNDRPDIPAPLAAAVECMLAKQVEDRIQTCVEVAEALAPFSDGADLKSLIAAAHSASDAPRSAADSESAANSDPKSQTILVGSSVGDAKPAVAGDAPSEPMQRPPRGPSADTATAADRTQAVFSQPPTTRRKTGWLFGGALALAVGGLAAGLFFGGVFQSDPASDGDASSTGTITAGGGRAAAGDLTSSGGGPAGDESTTDDGLALPLLRPQFKSIPEQSVRENEKFTLLVELDNIGELRDRIAFDLARGAPDGMRIDPSTGIVRWEPGEEHGGPDGVFPVTVLAKSLSSDVASGETSFVVRVQEVNQPPRVADARGNVIPTNVPKRISAIEGELLEVAFVALDDDVPPNPVSVTPAKPLPQGARIVASEDEPGVYRLQWTPSEAQGNGEAVLISLQGDDGADQSAIVVLSVNVEEVNQPPVLSRVNGKPVADDALKIAAKEGEPVEVAFMMTDADLPANRLTLESTAPLPKGARLRPSEDNPRLWTFSFTPGEEHGGEKPLTVPLRVKDEQDASEVATLVLDVAEVNQPPTLAQINGEAFKEDEPWKVSVKEGESLELTFDGDDADLPVDPLVLAAAEKLPGDAKIVPLEDKPRSWKLVWTPGEEFGGEKPVALKLHVKDGQDESSVRTVIVDVAEVNQPPELATIDGKALEDAKEYPAETKEGREVSLKLLARDADLPPNKLDLEPIGELPKGARLAVSEDNPREWTLSFTPGEEFGGDEPVKIPVRVKDADDVSSTLTILVKVDEVNQPPVLAKINGKPYDEETPWEFTGKEGEALELLIEGTDADLPANPLLLAAVDDLPGAARILPVEDKPGSWKLLWTPEEEFGGDKPVSLKLHVKDGQDASAVREVTLAIEEVNKPPVLASINGLPLKDEREFSADAKEGKELALALIARDVDLPANPLTIEPVGKLPDGVRIEADEEKPRTWTLRYLPGEETGGEAPVRIPLRVKDGAEMSETTTLVVKVEETNVPPVFRTVGGKPLPDEEPAAFDAKEGEPLELVIVADDADLPANEVAIAAGDLPEGAKLEPVEDKPHTWKLVWTPGEEFGGPDAVELPLKLTDDAKGETSTTLLVNVAEVNSPPALPETGVREFGPGQPLHFDLEVSDTDMPQQELSFELFPSEGVSAAGEWIEVDDEPLRLRVTWQPEGEVKAGEEYAVRVRLSDDGKPAMSVERSYTVRMSPYMTNSLGMRLAAVPGGTFLIGNQNVEKLEKILPQAPARPNVPGQPNGTNPNQPNIPRNLPPNVRNPFNTNPSQQDDEEKEIIPDDLPTREITIGSTFYIGAFEVTQAEYAEIMEVNPSYFSEAGRGADAVSDLDANRLPVESITYEDAVEFCRRLSERPEEKALGRVYRLPTEAEWEYACRAGTKTIFAFGDTLSSQQANFDGRFPSPGAERGPFLERTTAVDSYEANAFGVYGMHGNVSEWCLDWYAVETYGGETWNARGPETGEERVVRGGNYRSKWSYQCRSSMRDSRKPTDRSPRIGFRVVCEIGGPVEATAAAVKKAEKNDDE
ncbi:MAG: hypothetical protein DWQ41_04405 [Planctomycetota bacterium]|nr:MAG: hypothetical protein DWQ41_04405 [Planctomycetota bacterium]